MFFKKISKRKEVPEKNAAVHDTSPGKQFKQAMRKAADAIQTGAVMLLWFPFVLVAAPVLHLADAADTEYYPPQEEILKSLEFEQALKEKSSEHSVSS